ncbi:MAG TPA: serine hydrolase domain-containing protein [Chryseolinea sp.]
MKYIPSSVLATLISMLLMVSSFSCQVDSVSQNADIDRIFEKYNTKSGPGCVVSVIHNGKVVHTKGYGLANLEYDIAITPSTVFDIASVSKQFTGYAISTLLHEGRISLDDDIRKYLPEVPDFGKTITIRHLVHHTSGLRDWPQTLNVAGWRWDEVFSFEDILRMVKNQKELDFDPGTQFMYSNTGYNLLAAIVEKVSGQSFREWTAENIFSGLDMRSSQFLDDHHKVIKNLAYSYHRSGSQFAKSSTGLTAYGSSSLFTTVEDLAKWVINFDKEIASKNPVYLRMLEDGVLSNGEKVGYGYGLGLGEEGKLKTVSHTGGWAGYRTVVMNFPSEKFSCIILSNASDFNPYAYSLDVAKLFLEENFKGNEKGADSVKNMPTVAVDTAFARKATGMYQLGDGWYVTITLEGGQLMTKANGEEKFPMKAKSDSVFWIDAYDASMTFLEDNDGNVSSLRYRWIDSAKKVIPRQVDINLLSNYTGTYYSEELSCEYHVALTNGKLMMHHMRLGEFELQPDPVTAEQFSSTVGRVLFVKDEEDKLTGFRLSGGRVKNLRFDKK